MSSASFNTSWDLIFAAREKSSTTHEVIKNTVPKIYKGDMELKASTWEKANSPSAAKKNFGSTCSPESQLDKYGTRTRRIPARKTMKYL